MKILIFIGCGIGDVLLSVPFINGIKKEYPNAEINTLALVNRAGPGLSEGFQIIKNYCPYINKMIEIEETSSFLNKGKIIMDLMKTNYDLSIDLWPPTNKKTFFINLITRGKTAGFTKKHDIYIIPKDEQKVELEEKLLSKIIGKNISISYPMFKHLYKKSNIVTVSVSRDDDPLRSWNIERWAEILNKLYKEYKLDVMFIGADVNRERIINITDALDFIPKVSLNELSKIQQYVAKAKLHLSENCGVAHIAATTNTPVISISQGLKGWKPYGKNNIEIYGKTMNDIKVNDLWKQIKKKLI